MNFLADRQFWGDIANNTRQAAGGLLSATLGAPVDIATMVMRPFGYKVDDKKVVGSSEHIAGLLGLDTESIPYKVASLMPTDATDLMKYGGLLAAGSIKGVKGPKKTKYELAHEVAQRNAAKPIAEGGLGLPTDNTAMDRARAMGFVDAYHGTTGDVTQFNPQFRGSATGAPSAKKADFAARHPEVAVGYSLLGDGREANAIQRELAAAEAARDWDKQEALTLRLEDLVFGKRDYANKVSDARFEAEKDFNRVLGKYEVEQPYHIYGPSALDHKEEARVLPMTQVRQKAFDRAYEKLPPAQDVYKQIQEVYSGPTLWNTVDEYEQIANAIAAKDPRLGDLYRAAHDGRWESMPEFQKHPEALRELQDAFSQIKAKDAEYFALGVPDGANVMPLMINTSDFAVKDFKGMRYRDESYNDLIKEAARQKKPGVLLQNTFDPGQRLYNERTDVFAVRDPARIRSRFAAFDPARKHEADLLGYATLPTLGLAGLLGLGGLAGLSYLEQR